MLRILHVIPGWTEERGGPSYVQSALVRHQVAAGHEVTVLTTDQGARHGERPVPVAEGAAVERLSVQGPDRLAYAPGFKLAVRAQLRSSDLVHVHSLFTYPVHVALREARRAGIPVVLRPCGHLHRYSLRRSGWRKRAYLTTWGRMIRRACTAWHYTSLNESAESWPWDTSPRFVLPNGIEPDEYGMDRRDARASVYHQWPQLGEAPYVLFLGRLHPKKRLDLLLGGFLTGAPHPFRLVVAGPDETGLWSSLFTQFLSGAARAGRVLYVGTVTGPSKVALLAGARLFALPSEHENFGVAALEALAAGTPVLLSPHVDLAQEAVAAGLGAVVPLVASAWAEALARMLGSSTAEADTAQRARQWAAEHFAWRRLAGELEQRYRLAMATRGACSCL